MRRPLLVGNWKMNTSLDEALKLAHATAEVADRVQPDVEVGICPPFPWIVPITELVRTSSLTVGAQDISAEPDGALTGDVSATMLGPWCQFVLVGHSERRTIHQESDELVARKVRRARDEDLGIVLCVGESADQRASGHAESAVTSQLETALSGASTVGAASLSVAYEPIWAIGSGKAATVEEVQDMSAAIRRWLLAHHGAIADRIRILYGGSVSGQNVRAFFDAPDIDGALVGRASLDAETFEALIEAAIGSR